MIVPTRLEQANSILAFVHKGMRFEAGRNGLVLCWTNYKGEPCRKRWVPLSRGSDYPSIRGLPFGRTRTQAVMELSRWARGIPVRPVGMWRRYAAVGGSPTCLDVARVAGWPERVPCVFCGRLLGNGVAYDLYDNDELKHPGPGCWYGEGCKSPKEKAGA